MTTNTKKKFFHGDWPKLKEGKILSKRFLSWTGWTQGGKETAQLFSSMADPPSEGNRKGELYLDSEHRDPLDPCFVHGSKADLLAGKVCVIRDEIELFERCADGSWHWKELSGDNFTPVCLHLPDGHVILVLAKTQNNNYKIVFK